MARKADRTMNLETTLCKVIDATLANAELSVERVTPDCLALFRNDKPLMQQVLFVWKTTSTSSFHWGEAVTPKKALRLIRLNWNRRDRLSQTEGE